MKRTAVYHKDDKRYRIVSFPGGLWQCQKSNGGSGHNRGSRASPEELEKVKGDLSKVPHYDHWQPLYRVTSWLVAKTQLDSMVLAKELPAAS